MKYDDFPMKHDDFPMKNGDFPWPDLSKNHRGLVCVASGTARFQWSWRRAFGGRQGGARADVILLEAEIERNHWETDQDTSSFAVKFVDLYLVGGLEHGFYEFPFSWEE